MARLDLRRRRRTGSRRAPRRSPQAVGLGAAVDYLTGDRHGRDRARTSRQLTAYALERAARPCRACGSSARATPVGRGGAISFDARRHPPARRGPGPRRARGRGPGRPPLRPAAARGSACRRRPGRRSTSTPRPARSTRWSTGWSTCGVLRWSSVMRARRSCTRRSSWTTTSTRTARACGSRSTAEVHHVNPTCGDEMTLRVHAGDGDGVADVSYDGQGCSISQASASVLNELVIGKTVDEALPMHDDVPRADAGQGHRSSPTRTCWRTPSRSPVSPSTRRG